MENCITVIVKELSGFDRVFQLVYQPNPIWEFKGEWITDDNTNVYFDLNGRFGELIDYCHKNGFCYESKECVVAYRKESKNISHVDIQGLINDIERNGFMYKVVEY